MKIRLLRHATLVVMLDDVHILVDPMLSPAQAMEPIANAGNQLRIPMVELPFSEIELRTLLQRMDASLVTHTHRDHWDAAAQELLPKTLPILGQPEDELLIGRAGFTTVLPVWDQLEWRGISLQRTGGQHGSGELGRKMGPVSGFVLRGANFPTLYIAGDTIWCPEVEQALAQYAPEVIVLNAGEATYATGGGPITMSADDVIQVCRHAPQSRVIAVHMETINHCRLTRAVLREQVSAAGLSEQVLIPADGETLSF